MLNKRQKVFLLISWVCNIVAAQSFQDQITIHTLQYPQERVYVHFDKQVYTHAETIWFKAYLRNGFYDDSLSKILYVDLLDDNNKLIKQHFFPIVLSASSGQLEIPNDYNRKYIKVRVYTRWMLNFGNDFIFEKTFPLLSDVKSDSIQNEKVIPLLFIFPEGGTTLANVENKFAFIAHDQSGNPVDIRGTVKNRLGQPIVSFQSVHNGIGYFLLTPDIDEKYLLEWKTNDGILRETTLPEISATDIVLSANTKDGFCYYNLRKPEINTSNKKVTVIAMIYNKLVYMANINFAKEQVINGKIPLQQLPTGILQITVLNENNIPLCERIVFINRNDYAFNIVLKMTPPGFNKREENEIEIQADSTADITNMSLSVTDATLPYKTDENIYSHLLLSSQIKGRVFNPAYYFSDNSELIDRELDLIMLTHGWRKYSWADISKGISPSLSYYRDSNYLSISGTIKGALRKIREDENIIFLLRPAKETTGAALQMFSARVNKDGSFSTGSIMVMDSLNGVYSFTKKKHHYRAHH